MWSRGKANWSLPLISKPQSCLRIVDKATTCCHSTVYDEIWCQTTPRRVTRQAFFKPVWLAFGGPKVAFRLGLFDQNKVRSMQDVKERLMSHMVFRLILLKKNNSNHRYVRMVFNIITGHLKVIIMAQEPTNLLVTETISNITEIQE